MALGKLKLDKRRKYLLIVGASLLALALLYRLLPHFSTGQIRDEITIKQRRLAKCRAALQEKKELEARLVSFDRVLSRLEAGFLTGETTALAAVDIQNLLNEIASRSELDIKTMRVLRPEDDEENYTVISVEFTINSTVEQLKEILYRIESSPKYLVAKRVRISAAKSGQSEEVRSTLTIAGFMKKAKT